MIIAVGISYLVVLGVLEGVNGFPDQQIRRDYQSQIDDFSNIHQGANLQRDNCGNKAPCDEAGGTCIHRKDVCPGEMIRDNTYCVRKSCRCCVTDPSSSTSTSTSTSPPTTTSTSPPATTSSPPATTSSPPDTTSGPPATTSGPPATTSSPPATTSGPPATTSSPPVTTSSPPATTSSPPATTSGPPATTSSPPESTYIPPATTSSPPATTSSPPESTYIPPATTSSPPATTSSPPESTYIPPATTSSSTPTTTSTCPPGPDLYYPWCSPEECCKVPGCFFLTASRQCFCYINPGFPTNWYQANEYCRYNGDFYGKLPHPFAPVALQEELVAICGFGDIWLDAKCYGDHKCDNKMYWQDIRECGELACEISQYNPFFAIVPWLPSCKDGICLEMKATEYAMSVYRPGKPYFTANCTDTHQHILCERLCYP